ncbi:hypothetical protein SAMN02799633_00001, partial [Bacillus sp. UNCCL81]
GATGATGTAGATGATGPTGPTPITSTKIFVFEGTATGFQRIVGSPGATSQTIPITIGATGTIVGFTASVNINNLPVGSYTFQICVNVINNAVAPAVANIISTITFTNTAVMSGTFIFSIRPTDVGPQPVLFSNATPYAPAPATVTWTTNIPGNPLARNDALSLFLIGNLTQSAVYGVAASTAI